MWVDRLRGDGSGGATKIDGVVDGVGEECRRVCTKSTAVAGWIGGPRRSVAEPEITPSHEISKCATIILFPQNAALITMVSAAVTVLLLTNVSAMAFAERTKPSRDCRCRWTTGIDHASETCRSETRQVLLS